MKTRSFSLLVLLVFASCSQEDMTGDQHAFSPKMVETQGYVVPRDSIAEPKVIPAGDPTVRMAGTPKVVPAYSNVYPVNDPKAVLAGVPAVCTPGRDGFSLPRKTPATGKTVVAGTPEVVVAKEAFSKDQNTQSISSFGVLQGLKTGFVYSIFEDRAGNLWFANYGAGACKYDGRTFSHYTDKTGLSNNYVMSVLEDKKGNLWFGTWGGGVCKYDGRTFTHFTEKEGLSNNNIYSIEEDRSGNLWFATYGAGVCKYDGKTFTHFTKQQGLHADVVFTILEDQAGNLWFGTKGSGVCKYDGRSFSYFTEKEGLCDNDVLAILEDKKGSLWFGTENGVNKYDGRTFTHFTTGEGLGSNLVRAILEDESGSLWFGTRGGGLCKYDGRSISRFTEREGLNSNDVMSILESKNGGLWLAAGDGGVCKYNGNAFSHFTEKEGLSYHSIPSVLEDKNGNLWIATDGGGVNKYDGKTFTYFTEKEGLGNDFIWSVCQERSGSLWFAAYGAGVCKYDGRTFTQYTEKEGLGNNYVISILQDKNDNLWFATWGAGVCKYDGKTFTQFTRKQGLCNDVVYSTLEDKDGNMWFATDGGVSKYNGKTFTRFTTREGLGSNLIRSILEDKSGNLWFGTRGGGVSRYDGRHITQFTEKEGLSDNDVLAILEDKNGVLWFATSMGLNKLDKGYFINYTFEDGFLGIPCHFNSILEDKKGAVWTGSSSRLTVMHPEGLAPDTIAPNIQLTGISLFNERIPWQNLEKRKDTTIILKNRVRFRNFRFDGVGKWYGLPLNLSLAYNNNYLTFGFVGITTHSPQKVRYQYILEGFDQNWSALTDRAEAPYVNLPPGSYTFRVKAMNSEGYWSDEFVYPFAIRPPWYWAWWSKSVYGLIFLAALWGLYRWRTREQRLRIAMREKELSQERHLTERLQQIDQLKDQFLANTSHELRTPLHGIVGIAESLYEHVDKRSPAELRQNLGMIMASGRRLTSLVNDLLDFSQAKNRELQIKPESLDLYVLTEIVLRSCKPLIGSAPIALRNEVPADITPVLADSDRLQQILFNLVGNAIKFTHEGHVAVQADRNNDCVTVVVEDTGIGIPAGKQEAVFRSFEQADGNIAREYGGAGLGLSITKQLVELHGGSIWVESAPGAGSRFFFTLPVSDKPTLLALPIVQCTPVVQTSHISGPAPADEGEAGLPGGSGAERIHVLIVDDEPINHQVLHNYLGDRQYVTTSVMSGPEALEVIEEGQRFDLVLLDVMMPRMSGYEVCRKIRDRFLPSELPVIMVTAKNQLEDLVEGLGVGANDYLTKPFSRDEFLARIKTQLDLHRIFNVTGKFVPNEFIRALGHERITDVRLGDSVEREVSVMFCDIRDFTALSEGMTPKESFRFLNSYNGRMGPIIQANGGFVNQYLGDGIVALFPHSPADAIKAAVGMQAAVRQYNAERAEKGWAAIRIGIGIHTGPLIMGILGDERRMDAATVADAVNSASRIENLTKHYGANILVSEAVMAQALPEMMTGCRYLGPVQVKGKQNVIGIYECIEGDSPGHAALKTASKGLFDLALHQYFAREFEEAAANFRKILDANPADQPASLFLDISGRYLASGVPEGWTGVETMQGKVV